MTVPRLKLGRNYGIVNVISTVFDENDIAVKKLKSRITTNNFTNENYSKGSTLTGQNITKQKKKKVWSKLESLPFWQIHLLNPPRLWKFYIH